MPISGAEITLAARVASGLRRVLRRPDPVEVLKRRAEVRAEIKKRLYAEDANWGQPAPEIVVIRIGKQDDYPETDARRYGRGATSWFKGEVKGVHDRGLEVISGIEHVSISKGKARRVDHQTAGSRKVWVVGRIAYERIGWIDWDPDPTYSAPRFYVAYNLVRHEAYREVVLYEGRFEGHLSEMRGVRYLGERGGLFTRLGRARLRIRLNTEDRRRQKEALEMYSSDEADEA